MRSAHYFYEPNDEPLRAEAEIYGGGANVRIEVDGDIICLSLTSTDAHSRARRIADAINEGGRADAAPVA